MADPSLAAAVLITDPTSGFQPNVGALPPWGAGTDLGLTVRDVAECIFNDPATTLGQPGLVIAGIRNDGAAFTGTTVDLRWTAFSLDEKGRLFVDGSTVMPADNAAFVDGTTKVQPIAGILDDVAGTALAENDAAAVRIDSKRALVVGIEGTVRGTRAEVLASQPAYNEKGMVVRPLPQALFAITTFTAAATGTATIQYAQSFSVNVVPTGAVTSWTLLLEGSLDGVNYSTILSHTSVTPGAGVILSSGSTRTPVATFRLRCSAIVLGAGTNIVCTGLAMP